MTTARRRPPPDPTQPKAGERSREQLLQAAGEVFAEKGYDRATSKEICERARMNSASVNYHFGGFEQLYVETLVHAHRRLVTIEVLKDIGASDRSPDQKLRAYIALIVRRLAFPSTSWEMRLLSREIISPSLAREAFVESEILPKLAVLRNIIAEFIGAEPDDPVVGRSTLTIVAPILILAVSHRGMFTTIVPDLAKAPEEIDPLIEHFERFIHAGLEAVALQLRSERAA
jgi:TetR/AcrR family transcriptional regulator, regulator of cefoperazone and chloramphenicol sensitivity